MMSHAPHQHQLLQHKSAPIISCTPPSPQDMNNTNEPIYEQKPRFEGDLYTPRYVRKQGAEKEGYCDMCSGKWLQLKNSAFWYHKQFTHGISAVSGRPFQPPTEVRLLCELNRRPSKERIENAFSLKIITEALCTDCDCYIPLVTYPKKRFHAVTMTTEKFSFMRMDCQKYGFDWMENEESYILSLQFDANGQVILPQGFPNISRTLFDEHIKVICVKGNSITWWRHASKCHKHAGGSRDIVSRHQDAFNFRTQSPFEMSPSFNNNIGLNKRKRSQDEDSVYSASMKGPSRIETSPETLVSPPVPSLRTSSPTTAINSYDSLDSIITQKTTRNQSEGITLPPFKVISEYAEKQAETFASPRAPSVLDVRRYTDMPYSPVNHLSNNQHRRSFPSSYHHQEQQKSTFYNANSNVSSRWTSHLQIPETSQCTYAQQQPYQRHGRHVPQSSIEHLSSSQKHYSNN